MREITVEFEGEGGERLEVQIRSSSPARDLHALAVEIADHMDLPPVGVVDEEGARHGDGRSREGRKAAYEFLFGAGAFDQEPGADDERVVALRLFANAARLG